MIRISAIISCCSLLAADAVDGTMQESRRNQGQGARPCHSHFSSKARFLLAGNHELRAAVLRPGGLVVAGIERKFLAVADGAQPVAGMPSETR